MPMCTRMTEAHRQSTWDRAGTLSQEETNDGLCHGRETIWALEQVREASSWHAAAKVNAESYPLPDSGKDDSCAETEKGPSPGGVVTIPPWVPLTTWTKKQEAYDEEDI